MIHAYYSRSSERFSEKTNQALASTITYDPAFCLSRFYRWQDSQAHLIGRLLLAKGLTTIGVSTIPKLQYTSYHRPYLNLPVDFSISHSGEYIVCILAENMRVGVDIEKVRPLDLAEMKPSFSKQEWKEITTAGNPNRKLFDVWTRKEAVIKADGRGMHVADQIRMDGLQAYLENATWHLVNLPLVPDYFSWVASSQDACSINSVRIDFF